MSALSKYVTISAVQRYAHRPKVVIRDATPNASLTARPGTLCYDKTGGATYVCQGGTTWTATTKA